MPSESLGLYSSGGLSGTSVHSYMFRFNPYVSLPRQRRALLAAETFEPIPLHPAVKRQLDQAKLIDLKGSGSTPSKFQLFARVLRGLSDLISGVVLWNMINALVVLGGVLVTREVFRTSSSLSVGLGLIAVFFVLKLVQAVIEYHISNGLRQIHRGVQISLYRIVNEKLARIAPAGRAEFSKGQLKTLVGSDVEAIEDFISAALMQWTRAFVSSVVVIPALWFVSGWPGLVALGVVLAVVPIAALGAAFVERFQEKAQVEQDKLTTAVGEWVKNIRLVRFLGWDVGIQAEINQRMWRYIVRAAVRHTAVLVVWAISYSWSMFPLLAIFAVSLSQPESLNLMAVFSSFWLLDHLMSQIQYIPHSLSLYGSASAGASRVIALLAQPEMNNVILPAGERRIAPNARPIRVELKHVGVRYASHEALAGICLALSLNEKTAIIGSVGSGKTTLLEALIGELPLTSGLVEIEFSDGSRGSLWQEDVYAAFRAAIAYSPQQPYLSNASMRDNIDLSGQASFEDVQQAVVLSQLSDDIALFRRGLSEEVGESGINLSGGQKQRVSLARAFVSKRPVWVLDDPVSGVDTLTERNLMDAIVNQAQGLVLVTHRVSAIERCDRVIVLEAGAVVEDGHPKTLASDPTSHVYRFLQAVEEHGR